VIERVQAFDQTRHRHRHAVDFRRVGFGDERDAARAARRGQRLDHEVVDQGV
jgi:hypothetical protein